MGYNWEKLTMKNVGLKMYGYPEESGEPECE